MKKALFVITSIFILFSAKAQSSWEVDKAHSSITFSVSHFMISEITGNFDSFDISAKANEKFENPTFDVTIDAASINTNQSDRDNHLKSPDFFNVETHPNITFKSDSYTQFDNGEFELSGKLIVNGITKNTIFKGKLNGIIKDDESGNHKAGLKLTTVIEREVFNLGKGMSPIGKEVSVIINIEMNEK